MTEIIVLSGFFFISGFEEVVHHFLHRHNQAQEHHSHDHDDYQVLAQENDDKKPNDGQKEWSNLKTVLRTAFTDSALSFHRYINKRY